MADNINPSSPLNPDSLTDLSTAEAEAARQSRAQNARNLFTKDGRSTHPYYDLCRAVMRHALNVLDYENEGTPPKTLSEARRRQQPVPFDICEEWVGDDNLLAFCQAVERELPSRPHRARLVPLDRSKPLGPGNLAWERRPPSATALRGARKAVAQSIATGSFDGEWRPLSEGEDFPQSEDPGVIWKGSSL